MDRNPIARVVTHIPPKRVPGKKRIKRLTAAERRKLKEKKS